MPGYDKSLPYWSRRPAYSSGRREAAIPSIGKATMRILHLEFHFGCLGLIVGAFGQVMILMSILPLPVGGLFGTICGLIFMIPVFAIWLPVFCNQPLLPFPTYVRWCSYMTRCSIGNTLLFEIYYLVGLLPIRDANLFTTAQILMQLGWLSFVPQIHLWLMIKKHLAA